MALNTVAPLPNLKDTASAICTSCGLAKTDFLTGSLLLPLISQRGEGEKNNSIFHEKETKVLIDQGDQLRINNLNFHHFQHSIITAEI